MLLGLALVLASRATSQLAFQLTYGVLVGLAVGAFFAPMIAAATHKHGVETAKMIAGVALY